jgi:hypothetical protein
MLPGLSSLTLRMGDGTACCDAKVIIYIDFGCLIIMAIFAKADLRQKTKV